MTAEPLLSALTLLLVGLGGLWVITRDERRRESRDEAVVYSEPLLPPRSFRDDSTELYDWEADETVSAINDATFPKQLPLEKWQESAKRVRADILRRGKAQGRTNVRRGL